MIKKVFIQLNEALKILIEDGFIHRDLKPENILIKYTDNNKINFDIKLTDFGLSTNEIQSSIKTHTNAGTKIIWLLKLMIINIIINVIYGA